MKVKNKESRKVYTMPRESWEKLGHHQKLFTVVDESDEEEAPPQYIDNGAKPSTGQKDTAEVDKKTKAKNTTHKNNTKEIKP